MKRTIISLILILFSLSAITFAQEQPSYSKSSKPNYIRGGFALKFGPVFPIGNFSTGQIVPDFTIPPTTPITFLPAKIGGNLSLGYLIYIGPAVANNILRFGIDASFLDIWFASASPVAGSDKKTAEVYYWFVGQKFGPLITVNPVDKFMIDLSYKINANLSWHNNYWGSEILGQEIMMNLRYRLFMLSFMYNFGTINYNGLDKGNPDRVVDVTTFRVLLGFKF